MVGIWNTYVLQAAICMRPEGARSCLKGQELDGFILLPDVHPSQFETTKSTKTPRGVHSCV